MTRASWRSPGTHIFETGIDRGVLYIPGKDGVPWNGLRGVSESPTGGESRPYYLDGIKYLNLSAKEEFQATITAFSSPIEFDQCDGTMAIVNGLTATQQPRKTFSLTYRTLVGNDTQGADYAYKIHLIYNALASPSSRANMSVNSAVTPIDFSWSVSVKPSLVAGLSPTGHMIIDSRTTPPGLLQQVEDILYGSEDNEPTLPDINAVVDTFIRYTTVGYGNEEYGIPPYGI